MALAALTPEQKKQLTQDVGNVLVERHGKQQYYKQRDVSTALEVACIPLDYGCWAYAFFLSPADFNAYHEAIGEACDYTVMRTDMFEAIAGTTPAVNADGSWLDFDVSWFDVDLSWLEWPADLLGCVFDFF